MQWSTDDANLMLPLKKEETGQKGKGHKGEEEEEAGGENMKQAKRES